MSDAPVIEPRGEVQIQLGDRYLTLKPEFRVYAAISQRLGGVFKAWQRIEQGDIEAIATLIWAGATSAGTRKGPSVEEIGAMLIEHGFETLAAPLIAFVGRPIRGLSNASRGLGVDEQEDTEQEVADATESKSD